MPHQLAKVRSGPPVDDEGDLAVPVWAGVVPVGYGADGPVPDGNIAGALPTPALPGALGRRGGLRLPSPAMGPSRSDHEARGT
jgi:hypothetical protein